VLFVSLSKLSVVLLVSVSIVAVPCTDSVKELVSLLLLYNILVAVFKSAIGLCLVIGRHRVVFITCLAS
jgi:predicted cobalt transporter CbtA